MVQTTAFIVSELGEFSLALLPLTFLVTALLAGRYPGCDTVLRLRERFEDSPRRRPPARLGRCRPLAKATPAGGLLIACSAARRPPPLPV